MPVLPHVLLVRCVYLVLHKELDTGSFKDLILGEITRRTMLIFVV